MFKLYRETKSPGDDFLYWFLIRFISTRTKLIIIGIIWITWIICAPYLKFWLLFFKLSASLFILSLFYSLIKKFFTFLNLKSKKGTKE